MARPNAHATPLTVAAAALLLLLLVLLALLPAAAGYTGYTRPITPETVPALPSRLDYERMWLFPVLPADAPTPPQYYVDAKYPQLDFVGARPLGVILAVQYAPESVLKAYSELVYVPGVYNAPAPFDCLSAPRRSAARIYVDSLGTQKAGRCVWGLTKDLADFEWGSGDGWESFTMRDATTGATVFSANITDSFLLSLPLPLVASMLPTTWKVVQWPVNGTDALGGCQASDPAYAANNAALGTTPVSPLTWDLSLSYAGVTGATSRAWADPVTLTGHDAPLRILPIAVKAPKGAGFLSAPQVLKC